MKIGILGGTFDPVHIAHIDMAMKTYENLNLDSIWFMPSFKPPHKNNVKLSSYTDRKAMLSLALEEYPFFEICTLEEKRKENSYTSISLKILKEEFPDYTFFFIMGADSFFELETWFDYTKIFDLANIVVINRIYNSKHDNLYKLKYKYESLYKANICIIDFKKNISSSQIRESILNNNLDISFLDSKVLDYITKYNLYR